MPKIFVKMAVLVSVALFFSACGKSSESNSSDAPPAAAGEKPKLEIKPMPTPGASTSGDTSKPITPAQALSGDGSGSAGTQTVSQDVTTAEEIEKMLNEANRLSGAGDDYLRILLQSKQELVTDQNQKGANLKFANSIQAASMKVNFDAKGDAVVKITTLDTNSNSSDLLFSGTLDAQGIAILNPTSKTVTGTLKCMDVPSANGRTCETAIVEIKNLAKKSATAQLIFRRTDVDLKAIFPNRNCKEQSCEDMYTLFRETEVGINDVKALKRAKLASFEVIQGKSAFHLVMQTKGNEVIAMGGPLLVESSNVIADRTLNLEDTLDLGTLQNYHSNLHQSLTDVRIVGNNGLGKIRLQIKMKSGQPVLQDSFQLEIKRVLKDILPPEQAPLAIK